MPFLNEIAEQEKLLLQAMLKSDVKALDSLLSDDLIFTDHRGHIINKAEDLEAHRSGKVSIDTLEPGEQQIKIFDQTAIVSLLMEIKGQYLGQPFQALNRYTRVWMKENGSWKIVAAHASLFNSGS